MKTNTKKMAGTVVSLAMVGSAGLAGAQALGAGIIAPDDIQTMTAEASGIEQSLTFTRVSQVQGDFSYDQDTLSSNDQITSIFNKAAASMCSTESQSYGIAEEQQPISVTGMIGNEISATVQDMAKAAGAVGYIIACSCASNLSGGGAIANAEVEGVSFESLMNAADVQ